MIQSFIMEIYKAPLQGIGVNLGIGVDWVHMATPRFENGGLRTGHEILL